MAQNQQSKSVGDMLLSIPKPVLYLLLVIATTVPLFAPFTVPRMPGKPSVDFFAEIKAMAPGSTVAVQTDWTNGTRGESRPQFDALMRVLMRQGIKVAFCTVGDPQAPQVARDVLAELNRERVESGEEAYKEWRDYVFMGFFPGAEGTGKAFAASFRNAIANKRSNDESGVERPITQSPVLEKVQKVGDLSAYIVITGTKSSQIMIERLGQSVKMLALVTGVMGPETLTYYSTGQLSGLIVGLKGAYDLEGIMQDGIPADASPSGTALEGYADPKYKNIDKAARYVAPLHTAVGLMILAIVLGNVGILLNRKKEKQV